MSIVTAFFGGIIFAFIAFIASILYNSIDFINSNWWPGEPPSIRNPKTEYNEKDS